MKSPFSLLLLATSLASAQAPSQSADTVTGVVRDIDCNYRTPGCQILVDNFVGSVRDADVASVAQLSLQLRTPAKIRFRPSQANLVHQCVLFRGNANPPRQVRTDLARIVSIEAGRGAGRYLDATFVRGNGEHVSGFTDDPGLKGVLLTAFREDALIGYLDIASTGEIARAKVNLDDQKP